MRNQNSRIAFIIGMAITSIIVLFMIIIPILMPKNADNHVIVFYISFPIISFIFNMVGSIMILVSKWRNNWSEKNKKLWGFLSMFLIFFIGLFYFSYRTYKYDEKKKQQRDYINEYEEY